MQASQAGDGPPLVVYDSLSLDMTGMQAMGTGGKDAKMPAARAGARADAAAGNDAGAAAQPAGKEAQQPLPGKPAPGASGVEPVAPSGCMAWAKRSWQDYLRNVRQRPLFMLLPPLLTFCMLCALSVAGAVLGADKYEAESRARAESAALDWAASFRLSSERIFTPLVTLSILIQQNPDFTALRPAFPYVARQLLESVNQDRVVIQELQISPMGIIRLIYPKTPATDTRLNINIFKQPALRGGALNTIRARRIVLNGPLKLVQGNFGTIARAPIFIQNAGLNETWGTGRSLPDDCPPGLCYNATTREKFWGFATAIGPLDDLRAGNDSRLDILKQKGYRWLMTRPYTSSERNDTALFRPESTDRYGQYVFANSSVWPSSKAVASDISIGNAVWRVYLEPADGWRPGWERGVVAAVVLGNLLVAALVGMITASWAQQRHLLGDVMESNVRLADTTAKLQEEKLRLDALLVRQYNLLAVLGGPKGGGRGGGGGGGGGGGAAAAVGNGGSGGGDDGGGENCTSSPEGSISSREGLTLDRIETMRRQLAVNSNTSTQDLESIQTVEMLGEGTFGKVYKGLWRGTVVAVKTMILPSNMSGAEKREKMAVMEAAISSSLSHPNVVQTYTYAIRPVRENSPPGSGDNTGSLEATPGAGRSETVVTSSARIQKSGDSLTGAAVHSYEVRLVLEYCDKGCLRDALDDGAFLEVGGVNYLAVLDTAADVAKAMLHLHSLNVLHSDLKARNVMLSTGAADGRGVVAKVGDFGLSLKMDAQDTHISAVYQGTMTHMAPEVLLDGRASKAADVYAFGITLWELYSGGRAFAGTPRALLGHQITREHLRPKFPDSTPVGYRQLAERCWHPDWGKRPTFAEALEELMSLRATFPRATPPVHIAPRARPAPGGASLLSAAIGGGNGGTGRGGGGGSTVSGMTGNGGNGGTASGTAAAAAASGLNTSSSQFGGSEARSYYLEGSLDDSEDMDWNRGAKGVSAVAPTVARMRPGGTLPQIVEACEGQDRASPVGGDEDGGQGGGGGKTHRQQQQAGQQQQRRTYPPASRNF